MSRFDACCVRIEHGIHVKIMKSTEVLNPRCNFIEVAVYNTSLKYCRSGALWSILYTVPSAKTVDFPLLHSLANISVMQ